MLGRNDESTKTRIETASVTPPNIVVSCRNDESTKTRIETFVLFLDFFQVLNVVMTNPLKQGLKRSENSEKLSMKHCRNDESTKTRIETCKDCDWQALDPSRNDESTKTRIETLIRSPCS